MIPMNIVKSALISSCFLLAPVGASADLATAKTALRQGEFVTAIENAKAISRQYPMDALLIASKSYLSLRNFKAAEEFARAAVTLNEKSFAARFLLGEALYYQGKLLAAEYQFRRALDLSPNAVTQRQTTQALRKIKSEQTWKAVGSVGLAPSNNIGKQADKDTDPEGQNGWSVDDDAVSGVGVSATLNLEQRFGSKTTNKPWTLGASFYANEYKDESFSSRGKTAYLKYNFPKIGNSRQSVKVSRGVYEYGGSVTGTSTKLSLRYNGEVNLRLDRSWETSKIVGDFVDYTTLAVGLSDRIFASRNAVMFLNLDAKHRESDNALIDNKSFTVGLSGTYVPPQTPWVIGGSVSYSWASWSQAPGGPIFAGLYPEPRKDRTWNASVSVQNNDLSFYGFTPYVRYSLLDRDSNSIFQTVKSHDFFIGVKNAF